MASKTSPSTIFDSARPLPEYVSEELECLQPNQVDEAAWLLADAFLNDSNNNDPSPQYSWIVAGLLLEEEDPPKAEEQELQSGSKRRKRQREALHWLFQKNLEIKLEHDAAMNRTTACRCAFRREPDQPPKMVCLFLLKNLSRININKKDEKIGESSKISTWTMLRNGMLWFPILFGWKVFYRLLVVKDYYDSINIEFLSSQDRPYRVLERMVVHPSMQGRGIGSYFLRKDLFGEDGNDNGSSCSNGEVGTNITACVLQTQEERNVAFYSRLGFEVVKKEVFGESHQPVPDCTNWLMVMTPS